MYHDENKYITNQTCEYCNQEFLMFDKIIFPKNCENYPKGPMKSISIDKLDDFSKGDENPNESGITNGLQHS